MATIMVSYDTETAAVGEVLSLFTRSPNFARYELALDPETCGRALAVIGMSPAALRYTPAADRNGVLRARIIALAHRYRR